jgi:hypothetical protein
MNPPFTVKEISKFTHYVNKIRVYINSMFEKRVEIPYSIVSQRRHLTLDDTMFEKRVQISYSRKNK